VRIYVGTDIENVSRFDKFWNDKSSVAKRIFFDSEMIQSGKSQKPASSLAGIWCAKEAVLKAFAPILALEVTQIEITKNPKGYPEATIHHPDLGSINFHLSISISHTKEMATATALLQVIE
jgi:holo-[acyl-carrier protein] synthase